MRRGETILPMCRKRFWFWDSIVLLQTLALAASQVFATSLDAYFQVTIMLMVLVIGITVLAHCQPFEERLSQSMQVSCSAMPVSCSAMPVNCSAMPVSCSAMLVSCSAIPVSCSAMSVSCSAMLVSCSAMSVSCSAMQCSSSAR